MIAERSLTRFAFLSIAAALATIVLKALAWALTNSVGFLADAAESVVNLVAALLALVVLRIAAAPPDEDHAHGHEKAEYFAAGVEGVLILVAAVTIAVTAVNRLIHPAPLGHVGLGLVLTSVASAGNLAVGLVLIRGGRAHRSIVLEADGRHLLTDVWTSVGVLAGIAGVAVTGWSPLDPVVALAVAVNIVIAGVRLVRRSVGGLMDLSLPAADRVVIDGVLDRFASQGVSAHPSGRPARLPVDARTGPRPVDRAAGPRRPRATGGGPARDWRRTCARRSPISPSSLIWSRSRIRSRSQTSRSIARATGPTPRPGTGTTVDDVPKVRSSLRR